MLLTRAIGVLRHVARYDLKTVLDKEGDDMWSLILQGCTGKMLYLKEGETLSSVLIKALSQFMNHESYTIRIPLKVNLPTIVKIEQNLTVSKYNYSFRPFMKVDLILDYNI